MGKSVPCPGGCGAAIDYDAVPSYSAQRQRAGKFCPSCGHPLDEETAKGDVLEYGPDSAAVSESRLNSIREFHKARGAKP